MLDRLQEHHRVGGLGEALDEVAREAQVLAAVAQARVLVGLGVGVDADHGCGRAGEHVRAVALAAGHVDHAQAAHTRGDPLVDGEMAAEPVVLLGNVGQRALARERERRHALGLVALLEEWRRAGAPSGARRKAGTRSASIRAARLPFRCLIVPRRDAHPQRGGDPRRQHALPRCGGRPLRRQVGHRLRRRRPGAGARRCARRSAIEDRPATGALRPLARDRRRHRLLHAQPDARRADRAGDLHRHLPRDALRAERQRAASRAWT